MKTAIKMTSIRLDTRLADEAMQVLHAKSRSEAVHAALREIVALEKFKNLMKKHGGKLKLRAGLKERRITDRYAAVISFAFLSLRALSA